MPPVSSTKFSKRRIALNVGRGGRVVAEEGQQHRRDVEAGRDEERLPQAHNGGDCSADHRPDSRTEALRGLYDPDRRSELFARRVLCRHRERQRAVAGKQALHGPQRQHVPRARRERHSRHDHDEAEERTFHHQLAAEAIGHASPHGRQQRRQRWRDAKADAGPHGNLADVLHAELLDVERQERHHQREAREAHEAHRRDHDLIAAPGRRRCPFDDVQPLIPDPCCLLADR
jgi:hypothetical protein